MASPKYKVGDLLNEKTSGMLYTITAVDTLNGFYDLRGPNGHIYSQNPFFYVEDLSLFVPVKPASFKPKYNPGDIIEELAGPPGHAFGFQFQVVSCDPNQGYTLRDLSTGMIFSGQMIHSIEDPTLWRLVTAQTSPTPPSPQQLFAEQEAGAPYYEASNPRVMGDIVGWINVPGSGDFIIMDASAGFVGKTTGLLVKAIDLKSQGVAVLTCPKRSWWPVEVLLFRSQNILTKVASLALPQYVLTGAPAKPTAIPLVVPPLEWVEFSIETSKPDPNFPHQCPKCQGPAYMGFSKVDCKAKCGA